jgi:hypothetical protein
LDVQQLACALAAGAAFRSMAAVVPLEQEDFYQEQLPYAI